MNGREKFPFIKNIVGKQKVCEYERRVVYFENAKKTICTKKGEQEEKNGKL